MCGPKSLKTAMHARQLVGRPATALVAGFAGGERLAGCSAGVGGAAPLSGGRNEILPAVAVDASVAQSDVERSGAAGGGQWSAGGSVRVRLRRSRQLFPVPDVRVGIVGILLGYRIASFCRPEM